MLVEIVCHLCSEAIESSRVILRSLLPDMRKEEDVFQMLQLQDDSVSIHLYPWVSEGSRAPALLIHDGQQNKPETSLCCS